MERKITTGSIWWDKLGKPQYGGELNIRASRNIVNFDPYYHESLTTIQTAWMEKLHADDWTLNPAVFGYKTCWRPSQFIKGQLADSWEFSDPSTCIVHYAREFTGRTYLPPTAGSSLLRMWCFTSIVYTAWAEVSPALPRSLLPY